MARLVLSVPAGLPPLVATLGVAADIESAAPGVTPTTATLSMASTATTSVALAGTITLNATADQDYTASLSISDSGTLSTAAPLVLDGTTSIGFTATWGAEGAGRTVTLNSMSPALTVAGSPATVTVTDFAWSFTDASTLNTGRNTTTQLATGVPSGALVEVTPDLLPGQTLEVDGTTLNLVGDSTVPTVAPSSSDAVLAAIADIEFASIEVMDNPIATIRNATQNITYEYAAPGSWPVFDGQTSNRWNRVMGQAAPGDVIEISPGAVQAVSQDSSIYHSNSLDSCGLAIVKPISVRNIPGRGRWRVYPGAPWANNSNAIGIFPRAEMYLGERRDLAIEGFDVTDQFGSSGAGVRMRDPVGYWDSWHASITLRNFKIDRTTGTSLSGISGGNGETLTVEDGHLLNCGNKAGQEHNAYVSARTQVWRGVRVGRSRGWPYAPVSWADWNNIFVIEGQLLKLSAITGTIEGCSLDCGPLGDQSLLLQMKAGGNWTVRGNLLRDSLYPKNSEGMVNMCREYKTDGVTPNYESWAGAEGNSLLFEKNVVVGHYPRPIIWFFPQDAGVVGLPMRPATGGAWASNTRLDSFICRDNIAMVAPTNHTGTYNWMLAGFPGASNAMWINRDPNAGANWEARGNTVMTYGTDEPGFSEDDKRLLLYRREAGTISASGSVATQRFLYPHGFTARTDAFRGLA